MNASAGASTGSLWSFRTSITRKPMRRNCASCPTGGSVASSPEAGTGEVEWRAAALGAAIAAIRDAGGGLVEAYPEQVEERPPRARCLLPYGSRRPVRGVRLRARPEDSEVAVGDEAANPLLTSSCQSVAAIGDIVDGQGVRCARHAGDDGVGGRADVARRSLERFWHPGAARSMPARTVGVVRASPRSVVDHHGARDLARLRGTHHHPARISACRPLAEILSLA